MLEEEVYIIIAVIYVPVVVAVLIALGFAGKAIVANKGYPPEENHGFAWGFWLGVIGLIVCACKADRNVVMNGKSQATSTSEELLKYQKLLEDEIITQAEFDAAKQKLLEFV